VRLVQPRNAAPFKSDDESEDHDEREGRDERAGRPVKPTKLRRRGVSVVSIPRGLRASPISNPTETGTDSLVRTRERERERERKRAREVLRARGGGRKREREGSGERHVTCMLEAVCSRTIGRHYLGPAVRVAGGDWLVSCR